MALPPYTLETPAERIKEQRRQAAVAAHNGLQLWLCDKPQLALAAGNMTVVWHVLAVRGELDDHVARYAAEVEAAMAGSDAIAQHCKSNHLTALREFDKRFKGALHAV